MGTALVDSPVTDEERAPMLVLLELSATFDKIYHQKLVSQLWIPVGLDGTALVIAFFLGGEIPEASNNEGNSSSLLTVLMQGFIMTVLLFNMYMGL